VDLVDCLEALLSATHISERLTHKLMKHSTCYGCPSDTWCYTAFDDTQCVPFQGTYEVNPACPIKAVKLYQEENICKVLTSHVEDDGTTVYAVEMTEYLICDGANPVDWFTIDDFVEFFDYFDE
jgi:hypothetical protein